MTVAEQIKGILSTYQPAYLEEPLGQAIKNITEFEGKIKIELSFGFPHAGLNDLIISDIKQQLLANHLQIEPVILLQTKIMAHAVQSSLKPLPGVKNIIAVASGKGGVGKSTTAANLALALRYEGASVGILDADIYGPNQPEIMGLHGRPEVDADQKLQPKMAYDLQVMSIGFLIDSIDTPMVWRGPMVSGALQQLFTDTKWHDLDYLILDLPPGTGDVQLTMAQKIPVSGAVIVTTPQDIALADVTKAIRMFEKVHIPILGIIENMSEYVCSHCGHKEYIFGQGGADKMATQYQVPVLGHLPLDRHIRENADQGRPSVVADPNSEISKNYREIARKMAAKLAIQNRDFSQKFPKIVIEKE